MEANAFCETPLEPAGTTIASFVKSALKLLKLSTFLNYIAWIAFRVAFIETSDTDGSLIVKSLDQLSNREGTDYEITS